MSAARKTPTREEIVSATIKFIAKKPEAVRSKLYVEDDGALAIVVTNDPSRGTKAAEWAAQATKKEGPAPDSMGFGAGSDVTEDS